MVEINSFSSISLSMPGACKLAPNVLQTICFNFLEIRDAIKLMALSKNFNMMLSKSQIAQTFLVKAISKALCLPLSVKNADDMTRLKSLYTEI